MFSDRRVEGEVEHRKLLDDPYVLVAPRGAFPDGPVPMERLHGAPMVAWPPSCDQPRIERAFARGGAEPRIVFRAAGNEAVLSMVRAGIGSAVLPWLVVHGAGVPADDTLALHELRPFVDPREIYLLWQAGRARSP